MACGLIQVDEGRRDSHIVSMSPPYSRGSVPLPDLFFNGVVLSGF